MQVTVKFFAALAEQLGQSEVTLECAEPPSVLDVWRRVTGKDALPDPLLLAVNLEYADASQQLQDGDEVAFFPPVTGG